MDSTYKRFFAGSTFFMLGNFASSNKPDFVQLNFSYRLSHKNAVSIEIKTWKYAWPLGIPYGKMYEAPQEKFPGYIREYGFVFAYQRFWWKGLYSGIHIMNAWQTFVNDNGNKIDNGFQIFNIYRVGYHFRLFNDRFLLNLLLLLRTDHFIKKCQNHLNNLIVSGQNSFSMNQVFILEFISKIFHMYLSIKR
jgi:hypothetical protein